MRRTLNIVIKLTKIDNIQNLKMFQKNNYPRRKKNFSTFHNLHQLF